MTITLIGTLKSLCTPKSFIHLQDLNYQESFPIPHPWYPWSLCIPGRGQNYAFCLWLLTRITGVPYLIYIFLDISSFLLNLHL